MGLVDIAVCLRPVAGSVHPKGGSLARHSSYPLLFLLHEKSKLSEKAFKNAYGFRFKGFLKYERVWEPFLVLMLMKIS